MCSCINVYHPCAARTAVTKQPFQTCTESHHLPPFSNPLPIITQRDFTFPNLLLFWFLRVWGEDSSSPCHHSAGDKATWVSCRDQQGFRDQPWMSLGQCRLTLWGTQGQLSKSYDFNTSAAHQLKIPLSERPIN